MKKIILLLQLVAASLICNAQTPNWLWAISASGPGCCGYSCGIAVDSTDSVLFVGGRISGTTSLDGVGATAGGAASPFQAKLDSSGKNVQWLEETTYTGGYDYTDGFCLDNKDNVYVSGWENSGCPNPMFIEKYNSKGIQRWKATSTNAAGGGFMALAVDNQQNVYSTGNFEVCSGNLILGSTSLSYTGSGHAVFVTKLDSSGNFLWTVDAYGTGANDGWDVGRGITTDNQGHVFVSGGYSGQPTFYSYNNAAIITPPASTGYANLFVAEYDTSGVILNVYTATNAGFGSGDWGSLNHVVTDSCDNIYVSGFYENTPQFGSFTLPNSGQGAYIGKISTNGIWQWVNSVTGSGSAYGTGITLDKNSDVYAIGSYSNSSATFSSPGGGTTLSSGNQYVAKYANSNGALLWAQSANVPGNFSGVAVDRQKYVYITSSISGSGTFGSANTSGDGFAIAKMDTVPVRVITPLVDSNYCPGSTVTLPYTITGTFNAGNVFTAELSNSTGSFATADTIGAITSTANGSITITIPDTVTPGSNYLIRIVSSNPATSSWANGCGAYYIQNVYPNDFYIKIGGSATLSIVATSDTVCSGGSVTLIGKGGSSYMWSTGATTDTIIVKPTTDTTYVLTSSGACSGSDSIKLTVNTVAALTIQPISPSVCNGLSVTLTADTTGTNYTWSPAAGLSTTSGDSVLANPTVTTIYTVTGTSALGCAVTGTDTVKYNTAATIPVYPPGGASICSGQSVTLKAPTSGSGYVWTPSTGLLTTTGDSVVASPTVDITYTVTGIDSLGCTSTGTESVLVSQGPNQPVISPSVTGDTLFSSANYGNQWYNNGKLISGATGTLLVVTGLPVGDSITVSVTDVANGCSTTSAVYVTGINMLTIINDEISIYPNPTNGVININISTSAGVVSDWNLQLTDVLGRTLYTRASLNYKNEIDLSNLPGGVYFINVINNTDRAVFPVVKQN